MDIIEPILYVGISQSFFAGILISTRKPFTLANKLMAAWLFLVCIEMIFALINSTLLTFYSFPFIAFTYGPLLYLYARHITLRKNYFKRLNYLHFIPFIIFFATSLMLSDYQLFGNPAGFFRPDGMISLRIVYGFSFFLSVTVYSVLTFNIIRSHQRLLPNELSFTSTAATLNWLKVISISFYSAYLLLFILGGINIIGNYIPFDPYYVIFIFVVVVSFACSYYGLRQPEIFTYGDDRISPIAAETAHTDGQEKYVRSGLKPAQAQNIMDRLLAIMNNSKPYLNRDLTIYQLSEMTGISRHYITQVLNEYYGKNFFSFINEYRIKEAAERMAARRYSNYTILAIAYDSGFNSKSAFNKIFKEQTGLTPSEYRATLTITGN
jgi:AraC-like DNA-binding protein